MELKKNPEDFIVHEIINLDNKLGDYLYIEVTKVNCNTLDVIEEIAKQLDIPKSSIGFAGNKDKVAIATQYFSLYKIKKEQLNKINIKNVKLKALHYGSKPIFLGSLIGNNFKIKFDKKLKRIRITDMVNYYGEQRFSSNNKEVGKALLLKNFKKACELINNEKINSYLRNNKNYINALKLLDRKLLSLYINAFQSHLWNEVAKRFIRDNYRRIIYHQDFLFVERPKNQANIPLISFDTKLREGKVKNYYLEVLRKEGIRQTDYFVKEFPGIVSDTSSRPLFVKVNGFRLSNDYLEFSLPKGAFATVLISYLDALLMRTK